MKLVLLIFIFSVNVFAQNQDSDPLSDVDFSVLAPLQPKDRVREKRVEEYIKAKELKQKVEISDIVSSGTYLSTILSGSYLENIEGTEIYKLNRDINVYVYKKTDGGDYKYIVDKKNNLRYKTLRKNVEDVSAVADLNTKPQTYSEVETNHFYKSYDDIKMIKTQFNLHREMINSRYLMEIAESRYDNPSSSTRLEGIAFFQWNFPIELGISANYQTATFETVNSTPAYYRSWNLGPVMRFDLIHDDGITYKMNLSYQHAAAATLTYKLYETEYVTLLSNNSFQVGFEGQTKNSIGNFCFGLTYRRQWISVKKTVDENLKLGARSRNADSIGLFIGQDFNFNL